MLGRNWHSTYDRYIFVSHPGSPATLIAERADGKIITYLYNSVADTYTTDSDVDLTMQLGGTGCPTSLMITDSNDTIECYNLSVGNLYYLTSIQQRDGYTQTLHYNGSYQLTSVTDSNGRALTSPIAAPCWTPPARPVALR